MTDRTLRISTRMAEEIQQWASDELSQWPRDTAYAADLENLLSQLTAAAPAPDAVAESDDCNTIDNAEVLAGMPINTDAVTRLVEAARAGLNYLENTEGEFGITLGSATVLRAALAAMEADHD